jgi:hypothetical protein
LKTIPHHALINKPAFNSWPIIQLPEHLFFSLYKKPTTKRASLNSTIHDRLHLFKQGKVRELYQESRGIISKTSCKQANQLVDIQKAAQIAVDLDNFKTANARVTKHAPVALVNNSNIHVVCIKAIKSTSTRSGSTQNRNQDISCLHNHNGKAAGIHCDSLDIYIKAVQ